MIRQWLWPFVFLGVRSATLSGLYHVSVKSALLQDPGVGGRFCCNSGLRLGPTRPDGVSLAIVMEFEFALFVVSRLKARDSELVSLFVPVRRLVDVI